jgi:signal transduction histidine kinase
MATYIVEGTNNLNRLVSQVLHYARPLDLHLENTDVTALLQELKQHVLADERIDPKKFEITLKTPSQLIILIDPQQIKSALLNLLINALDAMPNGGSLILSADAHEDEVIIQITDSGMGIPKENLEKIFSPFFTTKAAGNGLGLAEVYKVIQAHAGTIECQSAVEQGTTFTVRLPLKSSY